MIGLRPQKPTWSSPHETVSSTSPRARAAAAPGPPVSAGRDELSDLALMLGAGVRALLGHRPRESRRQDREGHKREEPWDVEIEPVREDELEADQERGGE